MCSKDTLNHCNCALSYTLNALKFVYSKSYVSRETFRYLMTHETMRIIDRHGRLKHHPCFLNLWTATYWVGRGLTYGISCHESETKSCVIPTYILEIFFIIPVSMSFKLALMIISARLPLCCKWARFDDTRRFPSLPRRYEFLTLHFVTYARLLAI